MFWKFASVFKDKFDYVDCNVEQNMQFLMISET